LSVQAPILFTEGRGFLFYLMNPKIDATKSNTVVAFTDGSCYPNPNGEGGWAFRCQYKGHVAVRFGPAGLTTNNGMELTAILRCLQYVPAGESHDYPLVIYTDSQYALNSLTRWVHGWIEDGWKTSSGKDVSNRDIIEEAFELIRLHERYRDIDLRWVRGHSGIVENEVCDQKANYARTTKRTNWKHKDLKNVTNLLTS